MRSALGSGRSAARCADVSSSAINKAHPMSMFVAIDATITVKLKMLANSPEEGLQHARALLPHCRLLRPSFRQRSWFERLVCGAPPSDAAPVAEVVGARVVSSSYAVGE
jgi:hypothetical protein